MGSCVSLGGIEVTEEEKRLHREAEKSLKMAKAKMANQVKVLLLGTGDSGKTTILKQMRLIHKTPYTFPFTRQEIEHYRQLVFINLTHGMKRLLESMEDMGIELSRKNLRYAQMVDEATDLRDDQAFPQEYLTPLRKLWEDPSVQQAWERGNEAALPENLIYFFSDLERLFDPAYAPSEQDIVHVHVRTIGITETVLKLRDHQMRMVDVGGQRSERRKWIHCFEDVTSILFLASLNGYDQCLIEDKDANQMQDAMTIWYSISRSRWFKQTSIILFLNKNDLFERKIEHSDIVDFFPDYDGEAKNAAQGREYFKKRFAMLAQEANQQERKVYMQYVD